jgi:hypothetical protein
MIRGRNCKRKGDRIERKIIDLHRALAAKCKRVMLSQQAGGHVAHDVEVAVGGLLIEGEVKSRATGRGFKTLESWLGNKEALFLHRNRQTPMVLLPWATWERILNALTHQRMEDDCDEAE